MKKYIVAVLLALSIFTVAASAAEAHHRFDAKAFWAYQDRWGHGS